MKNDYSLKKKISMQHPQEKERLAALEALEILDTLPEQDYDNLTFLAAQICGSPISLISLVDESRQWFKSRWGLEAQETPREYAFCAHAIHGTEPYVISDATQDVRFKDNPLVTGEPRVIFYAGAPLISPDGHVIGTLCVIDHKPRFLDKNQIQSLKALSTQVSRLLELRVQILLHKKNETELKSVLNGVPAMIGHWNSDLINLNANNSYTMYFGKTPAEIKGMAMQSLLGQELFEKNKIYVEKVLLGEEQTFERVLPLKAGGEHQTFVKYLPEFQGNKVVGFFVIITDISEIKKLEAERQLLSAKMVEASKLSTLGEMAGGVAHEINTPLAIILVKTSLLLEDLHQKNINLENIVSQLQKIKLTTERIAKIVSGLRLFSRNTKNDVKELGSIEAIVNSTLDLCQEKIHHAGISLQVKIEGSLRAYVRPTEISQVLMNLISNSIDAVESLSDKWIHINCYSLNGYIIMEVVDSGHGISEDLQDKIMNPFFTTKEFGKGTGLGLSISKGIVESHGGVLHYDKSCVNTCFRVQIPIG